MARDWKFCIQKVKELYLPCSENKGADQLRGYREADLRLCFRIMQIVGILMRLLICGTVQSFMSMLPERMTTIQSNIKQPERKNIPHCDYIP